MVSINGNSDFIQNLLYIITGIYVHWYIGVYRLQGKEILGGESCQPDLNSVFYGSNHNYASR